MEKTVFRLVQDKVSFNASEFFYFVRRIANFRFFLDFGYKWGIIDLFLVTFYFKKTGCVLLGVVWLAFWGTVLDVVGGFFGENR